MESPCKSAAFVVWFTHRLSSSAPGQRSRHGSGSRFRREATLDSTEPALVGLRSSTTSVGLACSSTRARRPRPGSRSICGRRRAPRRRRAWRRGRSAGPVPTVRAGAGQVAARAWRGRARDRDRGPRRARRPAHRRRPGTLRPGVRGQILTEPDGRYLSIEVQDGFLGRVIGMYAVGADAAFDRFDCEQLRGLNSAQSDALACSVNEPLEPKQEDT
jgi:hypothetical protein